tara:strand:- start:712 stop:1188 length:477 start_codon:yes stop_codon:yes gene_type:complete
MATQKKTGNLKELYKNLVIEHARKPQNFGCIELHSDSSKGINPLCGDKIRIYLLQEKGHISKISFEGVGCAISIASASLLTETLNNQSVAQAKKYAKNFIMILNSDHEISENKKQLDNRDLETLMAVKDFPTRIKCATLCWQAFLSAIEGKDAIVTTE